MPRLRTLAEFLLVLAVTAAAVAAIRWSGPPIYDGDGYFHIRYAKWIHDEGIQRTFPWFEETFLRDRFANFNLAYHVLLVPFAMGDLLLGARIAAVCVASFSMGLVYLSARRLAIPHAALFVLAAMAFSPDALFRYTSTRPVVLSIGVAVAGSVAILLARRKESAAWAAAYAWIHCSYHLLPAVALFHDLTRGATPNERGLRRFRTTAWTAAGALAGTILNPYFPNNLRLWWTANLDVLSNSWLRGADLRIGTELLPLPVGELLLRNVGIFVALAIAVALLATGPLASSRVRTLLAMSCGFLGLTCLSQRFVELWAPFTMLLLGAVVRERGVTAWRFVAAPLFAAAIGAGLVIGVRQDQAALVGDPSGSVEPAGRFIAANVPEGELIFNLGWDDFPELFFHAPHHRYLVGMDPTFFVATDAARASVWARIVAGRVPDPYPEIRDRFHSRWVVASSKFVSFARIAERDPRFRVRFRDRGSTVYELLDLGPFVTGWRSEGWFADPRHTGFVDALPYEPAAVPRPSDDTGDGAWVDLRALAGVPDGTRDACVVATSRVAATRSVSGDLGITTDDEFVVRVGGTTVAEHSPLRTPPPGTPGGPPFPLEELDALRARVPETRVPVLWPAGESEIVVKGCRVGDDFGFFLRLPEGVRPVGRR